MLVHWLVLQSLLSCAPETKTLKSWQLQMQKNTDACQAVEKAVSWKIKHGEASKVSNSFDETSHQVIADPSSPLNASKSSKSLFGLLSCGAQLASPSSWCPLIRKCCALHRRLARAWVKVVASPNQVDLSSLLWLDWFRKVQKFSTCAFIYTWTHLDLLFWSHELF